MKNKVRHINVDGIHYKYVAKDWYIKIFPKNNTDHFVKIDFYTNDSEYGNVLMPIGCFKIFENGEPRYLIVNQPGLVANLIKYLKINEFDFSTQKQHIITEAVKVFEAMGYQIQKRKIISSEGYDFIFQSILKGMFEYLKPPYTWKLSRYIESKEEYYQFIGEENISDNLNNGITTSTIINNLNKGNFFDFPYIPEEKDTFLISYKDKNLKVYLSLIFLNGTWRKDIIHNSEENIAEGVITFFKKEIL